MTEEITVKTLEEYECFVSSHPRGHFMQSSLWARQKKDWDWTALILRGDRGEIRASLALLIRKLPCLNSRLMYGCRGPVCDLEDTEGLSALLNAALELSKRERCYLLKLDPDVSSCDKDYLNAFKSIGFHCNGETRGFEGIQPRFVFRLPIAGRTEEDLLSSFSQKTRYNIRLAIRAGVTVDFGDTESDLDDFALLMDETGKRDRFVTRERSYFSSLLSCMGTHARLYIARYGGVPLAGAIAISYASKVWYLYGASTGSHRGLMPNYLLQWSMIKWALESGASVYDFRGVSGDLDPGNPLYGLYRFKKGFGGNLFEFAGELDYMLMPFTATAANTAQRLFTAYKAFKASRYSTLAAKPSEVCK